jgi:hypothetical protein
MTGEGLRLRAAALRVSLALDRTLLSETMEVSGVPCLVEASAHGDKLLMQATRLGSVEPPPGATTNAAAANNNKNRRRRKEEGGGGELGSSADELLLPIPSHQLAQPLRKLVSAQEMSQIVRERVRMEPAQAEEVLNMYRRIELAKVIATQLKIVVKEVIGNPTDGTDLFKENGGGSVGDDDGSSIGGAQRGGVAALETSLHQDLITLFVCVDGERRRNRVGTVEVDDQATLAQVRRQLSNELEEDDLPLAYRFRFNGAPCARGQEGRRLAAACAPTLVLFSRDPVRDAKYARKEGKFVQGNPNDLFYDSEGDGNNYRGGQQMVAVAVAAHYGGGVNGLVRGEYKEDSDDAGGADDEEDRRRRRRKSKKLQKQNRKSMLAGMDEDTPESDSDDDPPPGPRPPGKARKETGMEARQRRRRQRRKDKQSERALRLKRAPPGAAGRTTNDQEPKGPERVEFVPYPLPAVVTLVQGSSHVWVRSVVDLNDTLTGDDLLRLGNVDSADYPVKSRPDDITRKRKPKLPPLNERPDVVAEKERQEAEAAEAVRKINAKLQGSRSSTSVGSRSGSVVSRLEDRDPSKLSTRQLKRRAEAENERQLTEAKAQLVTASLSDLEASLEQAVKRFFSEMGAVYMLSVAEGNGDGGGGAGGGGDKKGGEGMPGLDQFIYGGGSAGGAGNNSSNNNNNDDASSIGGGGSLATSASEVEALGRGAVGFIGAGDGRPRRSEGFALQELLNEILQLDATVQHHKKFEKRRAVVTEAVERLVQRQQKVQQMLPAQVARGGDDNDDDDADSLTLASVTSGNGEGSVVQEAGGGSVARSNGAAGSAGAGSAAAASAGSTADDRDRPSGSSSKKSKEGQQKRKAGGEGGLSRAERRQAEAKAKAEEEERKKREKEAAEIERDMTIATSAEVAAAAQAVEEAMAWHARGIQGTLANDNSSRATAATTVRSPTSRRGASPFKPVASPAANRQQQANSSSSSSSSVASMGTSSSSCAGGVIGGANGSSGPYAGLGVTDLFAEMTPGFSTRVSGQSWYPKKEALDEVLDILNGRQRKYDHDLGMATEPRMPPPRIKPKGRFSRLASDLQPLVLHPHHLVHCAALTTIEALARGLRWRFFDLCEGPDIFRCLLRRTKEKKLRLRIDTLLDTMFR